MNISTALEVAEAIPGGIYYGDERRVIVCGARCPEKDGITAELRQRGVSVGQIACLGGCSTYGVLTEGTYARVPRQGEDGMHSVTEIITT